MAPVDSPDLPDAPQAPAPSELEPSAPPPWPRWKRLLALAGGIALALLAAAGVALWIFLSPYAEKAARVDLTLLDDYDVSTVFTASDGSELGRIFTENRILLDPNQPVPPMVEHALVAAEDRRFYAHHGLDWKGLARAAVRDARHLHVVQGGSTITQQLAKHLINDFNRTVDRKLYEAFVALRIERSYTKDQILRYYLNRVYFGSGYFGIEAAAQGYFGRPARDLDAGQAALLVGIVRSPNRNSPRVSMPRAVQRRDLVLGTMEQLGYVSVADVAAARDEKVVLVGGKGTQAGSAPAGDFVFAAARRELDQLLRVAGSDELPQGLRVETSLDPALQREAIRVNEETLSRLEQGASGAAALESGAVVLDAASGAIRAYIGGRDFRRSQFDRAAMARREAPALLQPLLYARAFAADGDGSSAGALDPASRVDASFLDLDHPDADPGAGNGGRWVTVQDALAAGSPYAAARAERKLGGPEFADWIGAAVRRPVVRETPSWKREPLTVVENAALYQIVANGGLGRAPHFIEKIVNRHGEVLFDRARRAPSPLLEPVVARQAALTLQATVREGAARALADAYQFPYPAAGMVSYSPGYRDASFAGFASGTVGVVWVGRDDGQPLGAETASGAALPLWNALMRAALPGGEGDASARPVVPVPPELRQYEVNRRNGQLLGPAHLAPARGDIFVYLTDAQAKAAAQRSVAEESPAAPPDAAAAPVPAGTPAPMPAPPAGADWSDWLSTLLADDPSRAGAAFSDKRDPAIPAAADYRLPALRGDIVTAEGAALATTAQVPALMLPWPGPGAADGPDAALAWMKGRLAAAGKWLGSEIAVPDERLRALYALQRFQPLVVAETLSDEQAAAFPKSGLPEQGFALQGFPRRVYPQGPFAAHAVGYLRRLQARNASGRYQGGEVLYGDYAGAAGIEAACDAALRGAEGKMTLRTSPDGFFESAAVTAPPTAGNRVRTTLRLRVQREVEAGLDAAQVESGAMVVLDVRSGDVVAMASRPDFDPGAFLPAVTPETWARLGDAKAAPLLDRAALAQFPPGSTFKIVTSLAAMRDGALDPGAVFHTDGVFDVGNITYRIPDEAGNWNYHDAFARSINVYFFNLGLKVGRDDLLGTARDLGMGAPTGFLLDEAAGRVPDNAFVRAAHQRNFGPGDVTNTAIGQGDVLATPLQLAHLSEIVANQGTAYAPRLVAAVEDAAGNRLHEFPARLDAAFTLDPAKWALLRSAMEEVAKSGTGRLGQPDNVAIAAKTGTAQVGTKAEPREVVWFTGYVPAQNPEYSFCIMVEGKAGDDLWAAQNAAPIAKRVFTALYGKDDGAPQKGQEIRRAAAPGGAEEVRKAAPAAAAPASPAGGEEVRKAAPAG